MSKLHLIPPRYWIDRNKVLDVSIMIITDSRPDMKALVLNALGHGFDFEDVDIAAPMGRDVLVNVQASGPCHTDLLFATHDIVPTPAVLGHEVAGIVPAVGPDEDALAYSEIAELKDKLAQEKLYLQEEIHAADFDGIVGQSSALRQVLQLV